MEPAPPPSSSVPPSPDPPKFALPLAAWVAWGLYATTVGVLFVVRARRATPSPEALGELCGNLAAMLILPAAVAWIVWRVRRRSPTAAVVAFFVSFGLLVLGQGVQFMQRVRANLALQRLAVETRQLEAAQRQAIAQGEPIDEAKARQLAERAVEQWGRIAETGSGPDRLAAEASKAYLDRLLAVKKRYDETSVKIDAATFWNLTRYQTLADVAQTRTAVAAFARANEDLAALQDRDATALRRELDQRRVSADIVRQAVEGYRRSAGGRLDLIARVRETDAEFARIMLAFLEVVETHFGQWKPPAAGGEPVFENAAAAGRQKALIDQVRELGTRQAEYQQQLLAPKP